MTHDDKRRLADKVHAARQKVALTIHNDPMPSARLLASVHILNEVIAELRGEGYSTENRP